jgi:hypothetical protein
MGKRSTSKAQFRNGFFVLVLMLVIVLKIHNHELDAPGKSKCCRLAGSEKH